MNDQEKDQPKAVVNYYGKKTYCFKIPLAKVKPKPQAVPNYWLENEPEENI